METGKLLWAAKEPTVESGAVGLLCRYVPVWERTWLTRYGTFRLGLAQTYAM